MTNDTYKIRPAGRHILTIGRDLIQDPYAAVVELVKNAYDADSPDVIIQFDTTKNQKEYTITISDHGHGMSRDVVVNKWMVPSTRDKLDRKTSPEGRTLQGRKGIGRYSASILGPTLLMETTVKPDEAEPDEDKAGKTTTLIIDWNAFEEAEFLEDVDILIETTDTNAPSGTSLTISGMTEELEGWDQDHFDKLRSELKKMVSPISTIKNENIVSTEFSIQLEINDFPDVEDIDTPIEPYPIFDLFDYKISGCILPNGKASLTFLTGLSRNTLEEDISFDLERETGCGQIDIDIRVFDREPASIAALISRGLKTESGDTVGKNEARDLLTKYSGIGVYRNGFRIRPLGDATFDWLCLNKRRVQNPSLRIGSDQAIGYIMILPEEYSGLIEKSARDGLKDNLAFDNLKEITIEILSKLEQKRFQYREKAGLGRRGSKIDKEIQDLFSFDNLQLKISKKLTSSGVDEESTQEVVNLLAKDAQERSKKAKEIQRAVAIYQGQATLGKIVNVILHEGRKPLSYFRNQVPNLEASLLQFLETNDQDELGRFMRMAKGIGVNAEIFVNLFARLDHLAAGRRSKKVHVNLKDAVTDILMVFDKELASIKTSIFVDIPDDFSITAWPQDIYAIFTNLIDNSFFWMHEKKSSDPTITIKLITDDESIIHIEYFDNGPGIDRGFIESEVIFEPEFSTKPDGTGLGLAIAGEAAHRNGLKLTAIESDAGAHFRLEQVVTDEQ